MIRIRPMTLDDLSLGMRLKDRAGWNQADGDWRRILSLEPDGCFVAEWDGRAVGTAAVVVLGPVGWLQMVLVDEEYRGRGIGTRLVEHLLGELDRLGATTARLDATPLGQPVYEKLGFVAEYALTRWEGAATQPASESETGPPVRPARKDDLDALCRLDAEATATPRRRLLERLFAEQPERFVVAGDRVAGDEESLDGYAAMRLGSRAVQVGPVVARSAAAGRALLDEALGRCVGRQVFLDVPDDNADALGWVAQRGLSAQRPLVRMSRGNPPRDRREWLWASFGPEKG